MLWQISGAKLIARLGPISDYNLNTAAPPQYAGLIGCLDAKDNVPGAAVERIHDSQILGDRLLWSISMYCNVSAAVWTMDSIGNHLLASSANIAASATCIWRSQ